MLRRGFIKVAGALGPSGAIEAGETPGAVTPDWQQRFGSISDVRGIRVGHFTDARRPTGCTVILFDESAVAGVDVRGSAPGTRETDLLNPINTVQRINAIVLSGGRIYNDTLIDENAATHIAFGSGFRNARSDEAGWRTVNESATHQDVMVGTDELDVTAIEENGARVPLICGGEWQQR